MSPTKVGNGLFNGMLQELGKENNGSVNSKDAEEAIATLQAEFLKQFYVRQGLDPDVGKDRIKTLCEIALEEKTK